MNTVQQTLETSKPSPHTPRVTEALCVPQIILDETGFNPTDAEMLHGGNTSHTWGDRSIVVQRLDPGVPMVDGNTYKAAVVAAQEHGLVMADMLVEPFFDEGDSRWVAYERLEVLPENPNPRSLDFGMALGSLLGKTHLALSDVTPRPSYTHNYYNAESQINAFGAHKSSIADQDALRLAERFVQYLTDSPIPDRTGGKTVLLHGDPSPKNLLALANGQLCFIDYNEMIDGNPLQDLGHLNRALAVQAVRDGDEVNVDALTQVAGSYFEAAKITELASLSDVDLAAYSIRATRYMTAILGLRYIIDTVQNLNFRSNNPTQTDNVFRIGRAQELARTIDQLGV